MTTPRPSEADVEALAEEVERAVHGADDRLERSKALHLILGEPDASVERVARFMRWADAYAEESRAVVVNAVLDSDWLAAREAKARADERERIAQIAHYVEAAGTDLQRVLADPKVRHIGSDPTFLAVHDAQNDLARALGIARGDA